MITYNSCCTSVNLVKFYTCWCNYQQAGSTYKFAVGTLQETFPRPSSSPPLIFDKVRPPPLIKGIRCQQFEIFAPQNVLFCQQSSLGECDNSTVREILSLNLKFKKHLNSTKCYVHKISGKVYNSALFYLYKNFSNSTKTKITIFY